MSDTVAKAFQYYDDPTTKEAQTFVSYFDKFFDCLNVRGLTGWLKKRKPNLKPYKSSKDERLEVSYIFSEWDSFDVICYTVARV